MSKSYFEFDFFGSEQEKETLDRRCSSFRGLQSAISKIDPHILKSVIGSAPISLSARPASGAVPAVEEGEPSTTPLTIFYNGRVAVYDVPPCTAEKIIKHALGEFPANTELSASSSSSGVWLQEEKNEDMRMARKHSLQRFLEKRKDRRI